MPQFNDFGATVPQRPKDQGGIRAFGITNSYFGFGSFTDGKFIRNTYEIRDQPLGRTAPIASASAATMSGINLTFGTPTWKTGVGSSRMS